MSSHLAVATVTSTLQAILQRAVDGVIPGAHVTTLRPQELENADPDDRGINVFLYRVSPNSHWRGSDLPTRTRDGTLRERPVAALDLHYLLSFYGNDNRLEPQQLLGIAARTLESHPVLSRDDIDGVIEAAAEDSFLKGSSLARQMDLVRVTPVPLDIEELSKLWSSLFQASYFLSASYRAGVVLIEAEARPQSALPVRHRNAAVVPVEPPRLEFLDPADLAFSLLAGVELRGHALLAGDTVVLFDDLEAAPGDDSTRERLHVPLPAGIRAGRRTVRILQRVRMGDGGPRGGFRSDSLPLVLRPVVESATYSEEPDPGGGADIPTLTVSVAPAVAAKQDVELLLNERSAPSHRAPHAYRLRAPARDTEMASIAFVAQDVEAATYLVRVRVDGIESVLSTDVATGEYDGPEVVIP